MPDDLSAAPDAQDRAASDPAARDYRETVFLPSTPFPMRAGLPKLEPQMLERDPPVELYRRARAARQAAGAELFVLHDGPPYANGAIHIGHALNKILKDFVVRSRFALGFDVDYVPGWDCHGLPIEWKIEEEVRKAGRTKDEVPVDEFRRRCRDYAAHWIEVQSAEFQRLGVLGDWPDRYATMDFASEAAILAEFHRVLRSGRLYRGSKPVMWSPVERTALADAEVEYHDLNSPMIWVKFPVQDVEPWSGPEGAKADVLALKPSVVIWTTTPWTIPANRAIAFNPDIAYSLYRVEALDAFEVHEPLARVGEHLIVADTRAEDVFKAARVSAWTQLQHVGNLQALVCAHPLATQHPGYGFAVPLLPGDHVTDDAGTGFVHTAPGHGAEDYAAWLASGRREIPDTVDPNGAYFDDVPLFGGLAVIEADGKKAGKFGPANGAVMDRLREAGALLAQARLQHSYPHSWRSKAPVLYRNTPQWFIRMDGAPGDGGDGLRELALSAIDRTEFFPGSGRNRLRGMVETRPDWLVSRQRAWGTPLAMFVDRRTGAPLDDDDVNARIQAAVAAGGADAWFTTNPTVFLGPGRDPADFEKIDDILDVWFDSGCTHVFALRDRPDSRDPADLYLEGSDQARGWFQSSLLESCATRGAAPYRQVVTHGMTLTDAGEKMSKSLGNAVEPQAVIKDSGAEILRLWVATVDYQADQRIGKQILGTVTDSYRKLRNTLRYLLGALDGFTDDERVDVAHMPPLERFVLHRLQELDREVRAAYASYRFSDVWRSLSEFCQAELSAFYFDIRKDSLYCDRPDAPRRRAARTVMDLVFERLTIWLAPLAAFTCDEAWSTRFPDAGPNLLRTFPETPGAWADAKLAAAWTNVQAVLGVVTAALETERREKRIGSALEAAPRVHLGPRDLQAFRTLAEGDTLTLAEFAAEVFRTSAADLAEGDGPADAFRLDGVAGVAVEPLRAPGAKCQRSWKVLPEVTAATGWLTLRDLDAVRAWDAAHRPHD